MSIKSQTQEYLELVEQYEKANEESKIVTFQTNEVLEKVLHLKWGKERMDSSDFNAVISQMNDYIRYAKKKSLNDVYSNVCKEIEAIGPLTPKARKLFNRACFWLGYEKSVSIIKSIELDFTKPYSMQQAEKDPAFSITTIINRILSLIFRFSFFSSFSAPVRIIIGIIFWSILIGKIFNNSRVFFILAVLIVSLNIFMFVFSKITAKKYILNNPVVMYYLVARGILRDKLFDYRSNEFQNTVSNRWDEELNEIRANGLQSAKADDPNSIYSKVKKLMDQSSNENSKALNAKRHELRLCEDKRSAVVQNVSQLRESLYKKEAEVCEWTMTKDYNEGVLTPYVPLGFVDRNGKDYHDLISIKHGCEPVIISYSNETYRSGNSFRVDVARIVEQLLSGFYRENFNKHINMTLVDFEGLYFPESRTHNLMSVVRSKDELNKLFANIKGTRDKVNRLGDGRISTINPTQIENRDNVIPYNIVFFVGYDFNTIDIETNQLFVTGKNFGFVPFIFMRNDDYKAFYNSYDSSKVFSSVVRSANVDHIYGFEKIVSTFKYYLIVSSNKEVIEEKMKSSSVLTYDEFIKKSTSDEGIQINGSIAFDVSDMSEELYQAIINSKIGYSASYFTIDGRVPEYLDKYRIINI